MHEKQLIDAFRNIVEACTANSIELETLNFVFRTSDVNTYTQVMTMLTNICNQHGYFERTERAFDHVTSVTIDGVPIELELIQ